MVVPVNGHVWEVGVFPVVGSELDMLYHYQSTMILTRASVDQGWGWWMGGICCQLISDCNGTCQIALPSSVLPGVMASPLR